MQRGDLPVEIGQIAIIGQHIVSRRQTLRTRRLGRQNGADFAFAYPVARHHAADLQAFRAVDRDNAVAALAVGSRLNQQRYRKDHIG